MIPSRLVHHVEWRNFLGQLETLRGLERVVTVNGAVSKVGGQRARVRLMMIVIPLETCASLIKIMMDASLLELDRACGFCFLLCFPSKRRKNALLGESGTPR